MKKYIFMAVAAIAALSSCSSDNDPITGENGKKALTFTASMESDATRALYDSENKCASWEMADQISVNGVTYNAQSAGATTTFKSDVEGVEAEGDTYNAYFPKSLYNGGTPALPAAVSETWADGKFNMPMHATSTTTSLEFKNLCGVLKITVKDDEIAAVKRIKISSANKAISGNFSITNDAAVLADPSVVANTLTITYADAVATTPEGKVFYVAIPAQTYQELKIELDADGNGFTKSMTTKSAADITVARNKIYPITFADNSFVFVSGITLNRTAAELILGGEPAQATTNLTATLAPENATDKTVTWTSTDNTVATVSEDGVVTAVKAGTATITATAHDGSGITANCTVNVSYNFSNPNKNENYTNGTMNNWY